jgi:hypothetical protein
MPDRMPALFLAVFALVCTVATLVARVPADRQTPAPATGDRLVLVTLDGARVEEIFGGLDVEVLRSTLPTGTSVESNATYRRLYASTPEERRRRLMPFFWDVLMSTHGSIAGNRRLKSTVTLTISHRFSYPGYSELLTGEVDDEVIKSNERVHNPRVTLLEALKAQLTLSALEVAVFASWDVMNEIAEHTPGALTVNAGYEPFELAWPGARELSLLQFETPTPWNNVRHDAYTFGLAMTHLRAVRPRVLHLALGETDDWAHDGRYDRTLETYTRTDNQLRELWTWLQSQADYRDRTHMLITTDHGRGRTTADWRNHGTDVAGAEDVWMAFVSPRSSVRGEWRDHPPLFSNQAAATMASWMGLDWNATRPRAGRPILLR